MPIKHLVISGGGPTLIKTLASLQELERKEFVNRKDILTSEQVSVSYEL